MQFIFTLQYFVFIINLRLDWEKFEKWLFRFTVFLAVIIISLYIITAEFRNFQSLYGTSRMWAQNYLPGWPNGTPIPLLFGLFLSIRKNQLKLFSILIIIALVLTTSRGALLGMTAIISYFVLKTFDGNKLKWTFVIIPLIVVGVLFLDEGLLIMFQLFPSLQYRMSVSYDRLDILKVTMQYISMRPFLGFGGNSIDQIIPMYGNLSAYGINWLHTHNWILETILRYGIIGVIPFLGFIISVLKKIKDKDKQFMFFLILILGLFQTYLRNFSILFLMNYLTMDSIKVIEPTTILNNGLEHK